MQTNLQSPTPLVSTMSACLSASATAFSPTTLLFSQETLSTRESQDSVTAKSPPKVRSGGSPWGTGERGLLLPHPPADNLAVRQHLHTSPLSSLFLEHFPSLPFNLVNRQRLVDHQPEWCESNISDPTSLIQMLGILF